VDKSSPQEVQESRAVQEARPQVRGTSVSKLTSCLTTGENKPEKSGAENVPGSHPVNVLTRPQVRGIGVTEPTSCLTTGSTKMEMIGEMTENDDRKDGSSVEDDKGEKRKIVRVAIAAMMREMQIAENV